FVLQPTTPSEVSEEADAGRLAAPAVGSGGGGGGGRGGGRGGRGGGAGRSMPNAAGTTAAIVRDTPPPKHEPAYASNLAKRHEDRLKGVEFDWMDFQRDAAPFPLPTRADSQVNPPQEIFVTPAGGAERQLTRLGLRPGGVNWNPIGTTLAFTADSTYRNEM